VPPGVVEDRVELPDDLLRGQVSPSAQAPRDAEGAIHRASGLGGKTDGESRAWIKRFWILESGFWIGAGVVGPGIFELVDLRPRRFPRHVDGFAQGAVTQLQAVLDAPIGGGLSPRDLRKPDRRLPGEPRAQVPRQYSDRLVVADALPVQRLEDLPPAISGQPPLLEEAFPRLHRHSQRSARRRGASLRGAGRGVRGAPGLIAVSEKREKGSALRAARREPPHRRPPRQRRPSPDLPGRVDPDGLQEPQVLDVDPEGRLLGLAGAVAVAVSVSVSGVPRRLPLAARRARRAAIHADLRVENHVEVVTLVAAALDGVVHAARARDGLVDRLPELFEHLPKVIVQFHDRGDYRFRFREASRLFPDRVRAILWQLRAACVPPDKVSLMFSFFSHLECTKCGSSLERGSRANLCAKCGG